jgi:hypothetical protein
MFVAVHTTNHYVEANNGWEVYKNSSIIANDYKVQETGGHDYMKIGHIDPNNDKATGVTIHGNKVTLEAHTDDKKPSVTVNPDGIELFADSNKKTGIRISNAPNASEVYMLNKGGGLGLDSNGDIRMASNAKSQIIVGNDLTIKANNNEVHVGGLTFQGTTIAATKSNIDVIVIGQAIKVMP